MATRKLSWSKRQPAAGESVSSRLAAGGWFGCCPICFLATGADVQGLLARCLDDLRLRGSPMTIGPKVPCQKYRHQTPRAARSAGADLS